MTIAEIITYAAFAALAWAALSIAVLALIAPRDESDHDRSRITIRDPRER